MIKNLIFDLGGVVMTIDPEEGMRRFEQLGIVDAREQMGAYGQTGIFLESENGSISTEEFCEKLAEQAGVMSITYEQAQWGWLGYVKEVPQNRLNNLLRLKENYNVYLLSNTNPFLMKWAKSTAFSPDGHSIDYYFNKVFCSYELKDYKPAESIFRKVLQAECLNAEECVFIDDGPANVESAKRVGMQGLLVEKDSDWWGKLSEILNE